MSDFLSGERGIAHQQDDPARHGIGGNQPPDPLSPEAIHERLTEAHADLFKRCTEILGGFSRFDQLHPEITDDDTNAKAGDFVGPKGAVASYLKIVEAQRKLEKQKYLDAGVEVDKVFKRRLADPVTFGRDAITAKRNTYGEKVLAEKRKAQQEEAELAAAQAREAEKAAMATMQAEALQKAAELAEKAEALADRTQAPAAELTRTVGPTLGVTDSMKTTRHFDEANSDLMTLVKAVAEGRAPLHYLAFNTTRIGVAIRSEKVRDIPGIRIVEKRSY